MLKIVSCLSLLVLLLAAPAQSQQAAIVPHPAANLILSQLDSGARIIGLGERHQNADMHHWLLDLLADPSIQERIDDIVVEFANPHYQSVLDRFVDGQAVPRDSVRLIWRNTIGSPNTVWDSPVYESFFDGVRAINAGLPDSSRYRVLAGDLPIDWDEIETREQLLAKYKNRSEAMFEVIRSVVRANRTAVFIAGGAHVGKRGMTNVSRTTGVRYTEVTAGALMELYYPGAFYAVTLLSRPDNLEWERLASVPKGHIVPISETFLGDMEANLMSGLRNYDGTPFKAFGEARFADLVDAILYLGTPDELISADPPASVFADDTYWAALNRRSMLVRGQPMDASLRDQ